MLGINEKSLTLRQPQDYTRYLAGLVWVNKLLLLEYALPSKAWPELDLLARDEYPDFGKRLHEVRSAYMVDGSYSPQSEILSLLAYGQFVAKQTGGRTVLSWSLDRQTVSLRGSPISMDQYRQFPLLLAEKANQLLYEVLMFGKRPSVDLASIQDSMTYGVVGYWYGKLPANKLDITMEFLLDAAIRCAKDKQLFQMKRVGNTRSQEMKWNDIQRNRYLRNATTFQELLFILMHITGGQPARGPEIGGVKIRNTASTPRNIFVLDGTVLFTTEYDKKRDVRLTTRFIVRYLPDLIGQMLVTYQVYLLPFLDFVTNSISETTVANDYLFGSSFKSWTGEKLTTILKRETALHFGVTMGVTKWRQVTIGIAREFLPEIAKTMERYNGEEYDSDEEDTIDLLHEQASHSRNTGVAHYGQNANFLNKLQPELLMEFRKLSIHWHQFLGLHPTVQPKRKRRETTVDREISNAPNLVSKLHLGKDNSSTLSNTLNQQIQAAMICLYGEQATFRSTAQQKAINAVLQNNNSLIVIMGTAEGKSILFMISTMMQGAGTVIVIVPFRALIDNIVKRCLSYGIDVIEWTSELKHPHALVIVSTDLAITDEFMHYATSIKDQQLLQHFFLDECHTTFTDTDYREALRSVCRIRDLQVPITLLTATLPPIFERDLQQAMLLSNPTILRFMTYRKVISYQVLQVEKGKIAKTVIDFCQKTGKKMQHEEKGIIYCRSRKKCQELAEILNCPFYFAGEDTNQLALNTWQSDKTIHWITATGALGTGIDMGNIISVIHMDRPYGLIDMVQQAGRAGRNNQSSTATVIIDSYSVDMKGRNIGNGLNRFRNIDEQWLQNYLTTTDCRRIVIGEYLDNNKITCLAIGGNPCDICLSKKTKSQDGLSPYRKQLANQEQHHQYVIQWLNKLKELCVSCLIRNISGYKTHDYRHCPYNKEEEDDLLQVSFASFQNWRRQLRFEPYKNCYWCGLPQTFCTRQHDQAQSKTEVKDCKWPDIVLAFIFVGFKNGLLLNLINGKFAANVHSETQLLRWLEGHDLWKGEEKSHIMMVFETVARKMFQNQTL